mmetsp:Transcript_8643/g.20762  ORF Transcript_8643/g.20762 Transcript_8643/m.20762 type:complete len:192 (+) Transcript_8643:415-990(+)
MFTLDQLYYFYSHGRKIRHEYQNTVPHLFFASNSSQFEETQNRNINMPARSTMVVSRANDVLSTLSRDNFPLKRKTTTLTCLSSSTNSQSKATLESLQGLKIALKESSLGPSITQATIYRYAYFYSFNEDEALEAIFRTYHQRYLHLKMAGDLLGTLSHYESTLVVRPCVEGHEARAIIQVLLQEGTHYQG